MQNQRTLLVCRSTRCITGRGAAVYQALKDEVARQARKDVAVDFTGCHGFCQEGPSSPLSRTASSMPAWSRNSQPR